MIHNLVESYLKIVHKTQRDLVPKMIMHIIVNEASGCFLASLKRLMEVLVADSVKIVILLIGYFVFKFC